MKQYFLILGLLITLFCFTGCGKPRLDLNVASQPNVNPDHSGRPSPVVVKVYELRNGLAFNQADFQSLFERPMHALGANLIAADELVFVPGEARKTAYRPNLDTHFLGIVAGFRQMERAQWRVIKRIDPKDDTVIALEFNDTSILMIPDDKAKKWDPEKAVKQFQQQTDPQETQERVQTRKHMLPEEDYGQPLNAPSSGSPASSSESLSSPSKGNGRAGKVTPAPSSAPVRTMRPL
jgi:type VI secretion system protein VasD